jgi:hypothetical protein
MRRTAFPLSNLQVPQPPPDPHAAATATARFIINAGQKRRGETISNETAPVDDIVATNEPVVATAEFIIRCGKLRRGEI